MARKISIASAVLTVLAAAMALLLVAAMPAYAHHSDTHTQGGGSQKSTEDTKGNDRKSGYEDNSKTPQETNHGKGADNDGDADSDSSTTYTEDNDTNDGGTPNNVSDDGDNAHPSGKDRSVEPGGSGTQGKAESNPDDSKGPMRYEGAQGDDKPNGPGGTDLADQDGNNGCGNDDDFDDDNNGWCGKPDRVKGSRTDKTCPDGSAMPATGGCAKDDDSVLPDRTKRCPDGSIMPVNESCDEVIPDVDENPSIPDVGENPSIPEVDENPALPDEEVLGERIERDEQPAAPSVLGIRLSPALNEPVAVAGAVLPFTGSSLLVFLAAALALIAAGAVALKLRSNEA